MTKTNLHCNELKYGNWYNLNVRKYICFGRSTVLGKLYNIYLLNNANSIDFRKSSQFRILAVDPQVRGPSGQAYDVLFIGTTQGRILKVVNSVNPSDLRSPDSVPTLIEEIVVHPSDVTIEGLEIVRNSLERAPKLVAMTTDSMTAIPLARCSAAVSCSKCVALQDPYCAWDASR